MTTTSASVPTASPGTGTGPAFDPMVTMTTAVHASPGVYALLLGSGVSTGAGIKTGWGIVTDLVRRAATAQDPGSPTAGEDAASDPEAWWAQHGDGDLGYSALLGALAPAPSARQAQLARYFEADDEDREQGLKAPGAAHKAIAQLVARGSVRVIVTTNFDNLTERALTDIGISPQVIHQPGGYGGATPLAHSRATIIKLHGDYLDLDSRNTVDELSAYPDAQQEFLDRVLDEYGLIVCGWSADWDHALVKSIEGTRSRRYPMFWSHYGALGDAARRLTAQHRATLIPGLTADELFPGLVARLDALDSAADAPVTREIAVARLKRALPDPVRRIEVHDLIDQATTEALQRATGDAHSLSGKEGGYADSAYRYRADTGTLLHLLATGVFHDDGTYDDKWIRALQRLLRIRENVPGSYNGPLEALRHYPALLALWTAGISAVLARREHLLGRLLTEPVFRSPFTSRNQVPADALDPGRVLNGELVSTFYRPDDGTWIYPESELLRRDTREPLRSIEPDDATYQRACSRFELLSSLVALDQPNGRPWYGKYVYGSEWGDDDSGPGPGVRTEISPTWPLLSAGAFGKDVDRAAAAYARLTEWRSRYARTW
ncbi:SIR2 family protein [Streptomyces sp. NBC_00433]